MNKLNAGEFKRVFNIVTVAKNRYISPNQRSNASSVFGCLKWWRCRQSEACVKYRQEMATCFFVISRYVTNNVLKMKVQNSKYKIFVRSLLGSKREASEHALLRYLAASWKRFFLYSSKNAGNFTIHTYSKFVTSTL